MKALPENWDAMTHLEKDIFFTRYYKNFIREGEYNGINDWADEDIRKAYDAFLKESHD